LTVKKKIVVAERLGDLLDRQIRFAQECDGTRQAMCSFLSFDALEWRGHGQVPVSFFWQNWAACLGWALGGAEPWCEEIARACETFEKTGYPKKITLHESRCS